MMAQLVKLTVKDDRCIRCRIVVRKRQQAIECDGVCERWNHRTCGTGITQDEYRLMVKGKFKITQ